MSQTEKMSPSTSQFTGSIIRNTPSRTLVNTSSNARSGSGHDTSFKESNTQAATSGKMTEVTPEISAENVTPNEGLKPLNVFYIWYNELCRRQGTHPMPAITHGSTWNKNQILDFTADRIKLEDWHPLINALRLDMSLHVICIHSRLVGQKFLEYADTEERVKKIKKWFGTICTKFILKNLLKSISSCLKITQVLACLEFDGLPIVGEYLTLIMKALTANKSIKYLSFKGCPISDDGCQEICDSLHQMPNIEILNLGNCGLGMKSGEYLAKVIKFQQINRYCESWHSSLRYESPVVSNMAGLKRITLNNNPAIGDTGTELILQELVDDLWVRALDMQRCGVTQRLASRILDLLQYSRSLRVVDFRKNLLQATTVAKVLEILKEKHKDDVEDDTEYQWCYSATTLDTVSYGTYVSLTSKVFPKSSRLQRVKSTVKPNSAVATTSKPHIPTSEKNNKEKINSNLQKPDNITLIRAKKQLLDLYEKLKEETRKREKAEEQCQSLQNQVDELLTERKNHLILKEFANMKQYISKFISFMKDHNDFEGRDPIISDLQNALDEVHVLAKPFESPCNSPTHSMMFNSPAGNSTTDLIPSPPECDSECDYAAADLKLQQMFQSCLGKPVVQSLDSNLDLTMEVDPQDSPTEQNEFIEMTARSTESGESDSVETLKRLLEELDQDEGDQSWYTEYVGPPSDELTICSK